MKFAVQLLTEVLAAPPVTAGGIAHKRTASRKNPDDKNPYDGTPTSPWPACKKKPSDIPPGSWRELSAGRARELGLVPCTAKACFPPSTEEAP